MTEPATPPPPAAPNLGGQKLRKYRTKLCETQGVFGRRYSLSANAISRYERGERLPDLPLAIRFQGDGICRCEDWDCDPLPTPDAENSEPEVRELQPANG